MLAVDVLLLLFSVQARPQSARSVRGGLHCPTVTPPVWRGEGRVWAEVP